MDISQGIPQEIWEIISRHMTVKEWARISGVGKASWTMPLSTISLSTVEDWKRFGAAGIVRDFTIQQFSVSQFWKHQIPMFLLCSSDSFQLL